MEFCEFTLETIKKENNFIIKLHETLSQIGNAISYIHQEGYVHFDIKPSNIFILPQSNSTFIYKLGDFSSALKIQDYDFMNNDGDGQYFAPELLKIQNETINLKKVDIFSLGASVYKILMEYQARHYEIQQLYGKIYISVENLDFLKKMIDPNPNDRYNVDQMLRNIPNFSDLQTKNF